MYIPDNSDVYDAYEREQARLKRFYRDPFEDNNDQEEEEDNEFSDTES